MSKLCFSFPADVPPGIGIQGAVRPDLCGMPVTTHCFSYPADAPLDAAGRGGARAPVPGLRAMPMTCYSYPLICFSYPDAAPRGGGSPVADRPPPGLRRMPFGSCFRY